MKPLHHIRKYILTLYNQLYGLFKVGSGEKIEDSAQPGMFDLKVRLRPPDSWYTKKRASRVC